MLNGALGSYGIDAPAGTGNGVLVFAGALVSNCATGGAAVDGAAAGVAAGAADDVATVDDAEAASVEVEAADRCCFCSCFQAR